MSEASFQRVLWLMPAVTTLHNVEEGLYLPGWSARGTPFHPPVGAAEFRFALVVLTALALVITGLARRRAVFRLAAVGYAGAMLLNVFFPHVIASAWSGGYTPGVVTALVCNLPADGYVIARAVREESIGPRAVLISTATVSLGLVAAIPGLFALGRLLFAP